MKRRTPGNLPHVPRTAPETCAGKARYPRLRDAQDAIRHMRRKGIKEAYRLRPYVCDVCDQWHLTSQRR